MNKQEKNNGLQTTSQPLGETSRQKIGAYRQVLRDKTEQEIVISGRSMKQGDIINFIGLIVFLVAMVVAFALLWPYFHRLFEAGGTSLVIETIQGAGPAGVFVLLGLQFFQIVLAFIPGEVVQIAAGMMYGPWIGGLVILAGCVLSSAFVFVLVHKLGFPFVQNMIPDRYREKFRKFEEGGKLNAIVVILFLIPGMPKDVFTYLVPLTDMKLTTFLVLSNLGRIPGIIASTYAANGFVDGKIAQSITIFAIVSVVAVLGITMREPLMEFLEKHLRISRK